MMELRAWINNKDQLSDALSCPELTYIYVPLRLADAVPEEVRSRVILLPPEYLADCEKRVSGMLSELSVVGFSHVLAHTAGHIELLRKTGYIIHGGNRLNCVNSVSLKFYADCGLADVIVSPELTVRRINALDKPIPVGFIAYGHIPLMLCRRCPVCDGKPCGGVKRGKGCEGRITDRTGEKLELICSENTVEILNSDVLMLSDKLGDFRTDFAVLRFTVETSVINTVGLYSKNSIDDVKKYTRGLYYRGVQ